MLHCYFSCQRGGLPEAFTCGKKNPEVNTTLKVVENYLQETHDNDVDEETGFSCIALINNLVARFDV